MRASVKRLRRSPEEARRLILETAQALIARAGPEALRLQEIAAAAGISHPLILHHFGSREGLVHLIAAAAFGDAIFGPRLRRSAGLPSTNETEHRFRAWLAALIREHSTRR